MQCPWWSICVHIFLCIDSERCTEISFDKLYCFDFGFYLKLIERHHKIAYGLSFFSCLFLYVWFFFFLSVLFYVFTAIWERRFNGGSRQFFISLIGTGCDDHCNVNETSSDTTPHTLCISYNMHDTYERRKDFLFLLFFFQWFFSLALRDEFNSILLTPVQSIFSRNNRTSSTQRF